jgi:Protein of unknown function (DUF4026)/Uncharacterized protein conserved in bacteria (DUF2314)
MWPFLDKPVVQDGDVCFRGPLAPRIEQVLALASATQDVTASRADVPAGLDSPWAVRLTHPTWGDAVVTSPRNAPVPNAELIRWGTPALTDGEREAVGRAEVALLVQATTPERSVLRARKCLLRWLHLLMRLDGLVAVDHASGVFWSQAMLDDELAHDADLDVESLYTIHAIYDDKAAEPEYYWLHTHGLAELGAFDIDVVRPSPLLANNIGDPLRALAFAALEGSVTSSTEFFTLGSPGGVVDLVPADDFNAKAAPEDARLRTHDEFHAGRRAVVCEPRGLFSLFRRRPIPSRFLSNVDGHFVVNFSTASSQLMAGRACKTIDVFQALLAEFGPGGLPNGLKIGYPTASDPTGREHLWFEVHGFEGDRVDATLMNQPFDVPSLQQGQRGSHALADVSDWIVSSPAGPMTPRNLSAARRLRESGWPGGPFAEMLRSA